MSGTRDGLRLRRLSAAELLEIRRRVSAEEAEDELERCMRGNAMVLAACCVKEDGCPAFESGQAALERLTAPEMERLLRRIAEGDGEAAGSTVRSQEGAGNGSFDEERFLRLKGGEPWTL